MPTIVRNPLKASLRKDLKSLLRGLTTANRNDQSTEITKKVIGSAAFKESQRISVYLSLDCEVSTKDILSEMFRLNKEVFVPSYSGDKMVMLKIHGLEDYDTLPLTKWNIKQPNDGEGRENASETGGLDLVLMPGVAFSRSGGRTGHGMGYYDKFLTQLFATNPHRRDDTLRQNIDAKLAANKTILLGLAFEEQIVDDIPLDPWDILLDEIVSAENR